MLGHVSFPICIDDKSEDREKTGSVRKRSISGFRVNGGGSMQVTQYCTKLRLGVPILIEGITQSNTPHSISHSLCMQLASETCKSELY